MSGVWTVEACGCGFGYGDREDEFDTREECVAWVEYLENKSDYSVLRIVSPSGETWEKTKVYGDNPVVPCAS